LENIGADIRIIIGYSPDTYREVSDNYFLKK